MLTASHSPGRKIIKLVVMAMHVGQSRHERVHSRQLNWVVNRPSHDYVYMFLFHALDDYPEERT